MERSPSGRTHLNHCSCPTLATSSSHGTPEPPPPAQQLEWLMRGGGEGSPPSWGPRSSRGRTGPRLGGSSGASSRPNSGARLRQSRKGMRVGREESEPGCGRRKEQRACSDTSRQQQRGQASSSSRLRRGSRGRQRAGRALPGKEAERGRSSPAGRSQTTRRWREWRRLPRPKAPRRSWAP